MANGEVSLVDPPSFAETFPTVKTAELPASETSTNKDKKKKKKKKKKKGGNANGFATRMRKAELRSPFKKSMPLIGLMNGDVLVATSRVEIADFPCTEWAPVFSEKVMDPALAAEIA